MTSGQWGKDGRGGNSVGAHSDTSTDKKGDKSLSSRDRLLLADVMNPEIKVIENKSHDVRDTTCSGGEEPHR